MAILWSKEKSSIMHFPTAATSLYTAFYFILKIINDVLIPPLV